MADSHDAKSYLDIDELVARTGLSKATIWRLKTSGKIQFYQPGGKGTRVTFPENAIEVSSLNKESHLPVPANPEELERLPGPSPKWMSPGQNHKK